LQLALIYLTQNVISTYDNSDFSTPKNTVYSIPDSLDTDKIASYNDGDNDIYFNILKNDGTTLSNN
jgi:hypothetical protein